MPRSKKATLVAPPPEPHRVSLARRIRSQQSRFRRRLESIKRFGLPPTDDRGFVPRTDDVPGEYYGGLMPCSSVGRSKSASPDATSPSWDNVVREYENRFDGLD